MEHLVYGLAPDATEDWQESLLATRLPDRAAAERIIERAKADGFHSFRITTFDGSPPDFTKALKRSR